MCFTECFSKICEKCRIKNVQQESVENKEQESVGNMPQESVETTQQEPVETMQQESVETMQQESVETMQQESVENTQHESVLIYVGPSSVNQKEVTLPDGVTFISTEPYPSGVKSKFKDTFSFELGPREQGKFLKQDKLIVRRTDRADIGWGQKLEIKASNDPSKGDLVTIGSSRENVKEISLPGSAMFISPEPLNSGAVSSFGDSFAIEIIGVKLRVRRTDYNGGWGQNLGFKVQAAV